MLKFTEDHEWLKLDGVEEGQPQQWIPRENVLLIQVLDE